MSNQRASDSLKPAEFVQRIRQLGEKGDLEEEEERSRALEEEILQGRSERLARRAGESTFYHILRSAANCVSVLCALCVGLVYVGCAYDIR